jgi:hypothetical protein
LTRSKRIRKRDEGIEGIIDVWVLRRDVSLVATV